MTVDLAGHPYKAGKHDRDILGLLQDGKWHRTTEIHNKLPQIAARSNTISRLERLELFELIQRFNPLLPRHGHQWIITHRGQQLLALLSP